jgi:hypothetical protein
MRRLWANRARGGGGGHYSAVMFDGRNARVLGAQETEVCGSGGFSSSRGIVVASPSSSAGSLQKFIHNFPRNV